MTDVADVAARRLDLAGTRAFEHGRCRSRPPAAPGRVQPRVARGPVGRGHPGPAGRGRGPGRGRQRRPRRRRTALATSTSSCCTTAGPSTPSEVTRLADRLWYPIWDAGVRLDHSVRTVNQCRSVAADDLAAAVGLLDLAPVAGDAEVVAAARATVGHDWRANARKRLPQLHRVDGRAPPPSRRPRPVHRARPQGGPRRAARHDRAARPRRGLARRPSARRGRRGIRRCCSTSATRCTSSPAGAATGSAGRTTTRSPPCSGYADADDLLAEVSDAPRAPSPTPSTAPCGAPPSPSAPAPCGWVRAGRR